MDKKNKTKKQNKKKKEKINNKMGKNPHFYE